MAIVTRSWFDKLSKERQAAYLKAHPKSKFAKRKSSKGGVKNGSTTKPNAKSVKKSTKLTASKKLNRLQRLRKLQHAWQHAKTPEDKALAKAAIYKFLGKLHPQ